MLTYICGEVTELHEGRVVIENQGMGYELLVPLSEMKELSPSRQVKMYTYVQLLEREGTFQAFGFLRRDTLGLFRKLLSVSGVGPKAALGILTELSADALRRAVLFEDAAAIAKAPGIGKKTAQKLILELKDKLQLSESLEEELMPGLEEEASGSTASQAEAVEALTALGYNQAEARRAVYQVKEKDTLDVEQLLKAALKYM